MRTLNKAIILCVIGLLSSSSMCSAGFLQNALDGVKNVASDANKLKSLEKNNQSLLGSLGGGGSVSTGGGARTCPSTCPAEQASYRQEIAGLETLVQRDQQTLSKEGADYVQTQQRTSNPVAQQQNAMVFNAEKSALQQRMGAHRSASQNLLTKLEGQTGKLESKATEESKSPLKG